MSITLDSAASARIISKVRGTVWLAELDFTSGTLRYTNSPVDITAMGYTFTGYNNLVDVSALSESEANSAEKVTLGLSVVNQAMLAFTLGNVESYRGRAVRLYLQLTDEHFKPDGAPIKRWSGYMDKVQITRQGGGSGEGGQVSGKIEMVCSRAGMSRSRNYQGFRLSNAQHQMRHPSDRGLEYLQTLIEQPSLWLSKAFQKDKS